MRKTGFANNEFYHVYNRGVDRRFIFSDNFDIQRFYQSMKEFNSVEPIGSIYENSFPKLGRETSKLEQKHDPLVNIISYCLNPNHFHLMLEQKIGGGISEFMKRLGGGYTKYFNNKTKRRGVLFQGVFQSRHINNNEYLLHLSAYVSLNDRVHQLGRETSKLNKSCWNEYVNGEIGLCEKEIILKQFKSTKEYEKFALSSLQNIIERKTLLRQLEEFLIEEREIR